MIRLDNTTTVIRIRRGHAKTTTEMDSTFFYVDKTPTDYGVPGAATQKEQKTTNGTANVTALDAPGSATLPIIRESDHGIVNNLDTVADTLIVALYDSAGPTETQLWAGTLQAGDIVTYTHAAGWKVTDANGNIKGTGGAGPAGPAGVAGVMGPAVFLEAESGEDSHMMFPGQPGATGPTGPAGVAGVIGPAVFLEAEPGDDGLNAIPGNPGQTGAAGAQGLTGLSGPAIFLEAEVGEDGPIGPIGPAGAAGAAGAGAVLPSTNNFRLTTLTATPVPTTDQVAAATIYLSPYNGTHISTYDVATWTDHITAEVSLALSGLTSGKNYDVFAYFKSGAIKIDLGPTWNTGGGSDTARGSGPGSTAITQQDGVWVNSVGLTGTISGDTIGSKNARLIGTIRTTGTGTTEDSLAHRFVDNVDNVVPSVMQAQDATASWAYTTNTIREARGQTTNQVDYICCLNRHPVKAFVSCAVQESNASNVARVGIGVDSTTAFSGIIGIGDGFGSGYVGPVVGSYEGYPGLGYHYIAWLEAGGDTISTFYGTGSRAGAAGGQSGLYVERVR